MKGLSLLIESAQNLPFLGFYEQPEAYCILKYKEQRHVTPISKVGKNPYWMFQTQLNLEETQSLTPIEIYVYNSNSNAQDQLLGWLHLYPQQLNFITLTKTRFQLINSQGHRIHSFISISSKCLPHIETDYFTQKESIKIQILNHVQIEKEDFSTVNMENVIVKFLYGDKMAGIKYGEENHVILPYKGMDEMVVALEGVQNVKDESKLMQCFNIKNLKEKKPQFFKLRFFDPIFPQINYVVCLVFTIIPNSNLPSNFSWLQLTLGSQIKDNFIVRFYSSLESTIIKAVGIPKMLRMANSQSTITFEYFDCQRMEEKELWKEPDEEKIIKTIAKYKPQQSRIIKANELEWTSTQRSDFIWLIKRQKMTKSINISFRAFKQPKTIAKQIYPTNFISSFHQKTVKMTHIKISSCYLYEVLPPESELCIYSVDFYGKVWHLGSFLVKQGQSEYIVESRICVRNDGGWLVVICHQLGLKQGGGQMEENNKIQNKKLQTLMSNQELLDNHMIFKLKTEKDKQLFSGKVIYNKYFSSFAKKVSLTKLCKKFEQAVHNDAMIVQPKYQIWTPFRQGLLQIVNCQYHGFQSFNLVELTVGADTKSFEGFGDDFLCEKTAFFYVENEKIKVKMVMGKSSLTAQYAFNELFGYPDNTQNEVKTYCREIQLKGGKLKIWYKFTPLDDRIQKESPVNLLGQENLNRFSLKMPLKIGLKQFRLLKKTDKPSMNLKKEQELTMKIRMTQRNSHYESIAQKSTSGTFCFSPQKDFLQTRGSDTQEGRYVFVSVQVLAAKREEDKEKIDIENEEAQKSQNFYNAAIDLYKVLGKGIYEVKFYDSKTNKLQIIGQVEILTENLLKKQFFTNINMSNPSFYLKIDSLQLKNYLSYLTKCDSYEKSLLKNVYSYFVIVSVNGFYYSLISLESSSKNCQKSTLPVKETFQNDKIYLDSKCAVEVKVGSMIKNTQGKEKEVHVNLLELNTKQYQLTSDLVRAELQKLQIQIIGSCQINISDISLKQETKDISYAEIKIPFLGNRQLYTRFNIEQIGIIRQSCHFAIKCSIFKNQAVQEEAMIDLSSKYKNTDVSILQNCMGLVRIKSIVPSKAIHLKQIVNGELQLFCNSGKIQYRNVYNLLETEHATLVEKSEIQFELLRKNIPNKVVKKILLPSYLKTGQVWHSSVQLNQFCICFSIECFSNTLTTFNQGTLTLKDIAFMNTKVDKFKMYFPLQQSPTEQVMYSPFQKSLTNNMTILNQNVNIEKKLKNLLKSALIFEMMTENSTKKMYAKFYLSQMSLTSKFSNDTSESPKVMFVVQVFCFNEKTPVRISLTGEYLMDNMQKTKQKITTARYTVLGERQKELQIPSKILNYTNQRFVSTSSDQTLPSRRNGVKLQLQIPQKLLEYLAENNLTSILELTTVYGSLKGEVFTLFRSKQRFNIYYKYLHKLIQVRNISFGQSSDDGSVYKSRQKVNQKLKIEILNINQVKNSTRPVQKFIINQNPQYILTVTQSSYQIPKAIKPSQQLNQKQQRQSLIVEIQIHKLLSQPVFQGLLSSTKLQSQTFNQRQKRLLCLKTSPNDQILTNKFCLYFKHGRQEQVIYGVDLQGNLSNEGQNRVRFGYDAEDDEIDVFLCVEHFWNKNISKSQLDGNFIIEKYSYDQIEKQWISIMPLCHYLIKVSDIKKNNLMFTSTMRPFNYTLAQTSLSKELHKRFQLKDVALFGSLSFTEGNWGSLTVKVSKLGPIKLKSQIIGFTSSYDKNSSKILCFMKISIEYQKTILKEINTEAKEWIPDGYLSFKTFLSHLFLEQKTQADHKYLKFQMFTISQHSLTKKIFEKRYPLQDVLEHETKCQKVNVKCTEQDSGQMAELMQMELNFENTKELKKSTAFSSSFDTFNENHLTKVSSQNVDLVDMISYKNKSFIDVAKMLLSTKQRTHFQGYIKEVKQSFIYEEITSNDECSPFGILVICLQYLGTNARFCFGDVLEMLEMAVVKNPGVVGWLDELQVTGGGKKLGYTTMVYEVLETIIERDNKQETLKHEIPSDYETQVNKLISNFKQISKRPKAPLTQYFIKENIQALKLCINNHSIYMIKDKMTTESYIPQQITLLILSIIQHFIEYSQLFTIALIQNLRKWIQFCSFKSMSILMKMIQVVDKLIIGKKQMIHIQVLEEMLNVMIERRVEIDVVYQYWARQRDEKKTGLFDQILDKYYLYSKEIEKQLLQKNQSLQVFELKRTKILKLFYNEYKRLLKKESKSRINSQQNSNQNSRIKQDTDKLSHKTYGYSVKVIINPELINLYKQLFDKTLHTQNSILLNCISELIFLWKDYDALDEQTINFFVGLSRKYLEKDKKKLMGKSGTLMAFNINKNLSNNESEFLKKEQNQVNLLSEKNKKIILQNLVKHLTGKDKGGMKPKLKNQHEKQSEGFSKYSKYLITR